MLFCSCPSGDHTACSERRRQTIVPVCSYEDKEKPNCLSLLASCKTNYICRYDKRAWVTCHRVRKKVLEYSLNFSASSLFILWGGCVWEEMTAGLSLVCWVCLMKRCGMWILVHTCLIFFRSRLADFLTNCQPEARSISGCLKENYANCLLAYSGLIGELTHVKKLFWQYSTI